MIFRRSLMFQSFFNGAIQPPTADGSGMHMDELAVGISEARCQFLDGLPPLLLRKPDPLIGECAICHRAAQNRICAIATYVAVILHISSSNTTIQIESGATDQRDQAVGWLVWPSAFQGLADIPRLSMLIGQFMPEASPERCLWNS